MNIAQLKEIFGNLADQINIVDLIVCAAGVSILAVWLVKTSFATRALIKAPSRRNDMTILLALVPFIAWFFATWVLGKTKTLVYPDLPDWQDAFAENFVLCLAVAPPITTILIIAWMHFGRRLKGLGLNPRTIGRDFGAALLNLLAIWPVVLAMIILTTAAGKWFVGPEFEMPKHEELKQILSYHQYSLHVLIVITTILIVPVIEEIVFRGIFQTFLRSYIIRPWPTIILTSLLFIVFHENPQHWPALFALSLCLGYSYEKSGSLFRPIFIHSIFNAMSVFAALGQ